jgi:uncharacterized membrane protein
LEVFTRKLVSARSSTDRPVHLAETHRVEAFSDGVFAIAITLLVLDLRLPEHEPGGLLSGLIQQWPGYFAYLTSFLYIGVVWRTAPRKREKNFQEYTHDSLTSHHHFVY